MIQFYKNAKDNIGRPIAIQIAIDNVTKNLKNLTAQYRAMEPGKDKDEFKKSQFPAVTWSGTFAKRKANALQYHSELICIDIDKLEVEQMHAIAKLLRQDDRVFFMFISPSGNGLKIIFKIKTINDDTIQAQHLQAFKAIEHFFATDYVISIDTSGKDVCRLCFLCHDPTAYINVDSTYFDYQSFSTNDAATSTTTATAIAAQTTKQVKYTSFTSSQASDFLHHENSIEAVEQFTNNKQQLTSGNRNNWIYLFASNCNRKGIEMLDCLGYTQSLCGDKDLNEITATVRSAYTHHAAEFAKYKKYKNEKTPTTQTSIKTVKNSNENSNDTNAESKVYRTENNNKTSKEEETQFWYIITKKDKDTGEVTEQYKIDSLSLMEFLTYKGYYLYECGEGYQFCHTNKNIASIVTYDKIAQFVFSYLRELNNRKVHKAFLDGCKSYLGVDKLRSLPYITLDLHRDNKDETFLFFKNKIAKITSAGVELQPYHNFSKYIWDKQAIKHDFTVNNFNYIDDENFINVEKWECDFARFVWHASCDTSNPDTACTDVAILKQRFLSFVTAIGFMLDGYKHPSERKGVFAVDGKIGERDELNGRSGKSIIAAACSKLKVVSYIDGTMYDPKYQFRYESVNADTQIICFNDMQKNHDVKTEFTVIADNYSINKKNTGLIHFKYNDSAKVYYTTNHVPKGNGESYRGRMHIIEFSDFFNANHTPYAFFGHALFDDCGEAQDNAFYNFMCWCVVKYKELGLIEYANGNFNLRKLNSLCPEEFISFIESEDSGEYHNINRNGWTDKKIVFERWKSVAAENNLFKPTPNFLRTMIKQYCGAKDLCFYVKKAGGKEEYWIGTKPPYDISQKSVVPIIPHEDAKKTVQVEMELK